MNLIVQYDFIFRALINKYHCSLYTVDSTIVRQSTLGDCKNGLKFC